MSEQDPDKHSSAKVPWVVRKFNGLEESVNALPKPNFLVLALISSAFSRSALAFIVLIKQQLMERCKLRQRMKQHDAYSYAHILLKRAWNWTDEMGTEIDTTISFDDVSLVLKHGNFIVQATVLLRLFIASKKEGGIEHSYLASYYRERDDLRTRIANFQNEQRGKDRLTLIEDYKLATLAAEKYNALTGLLQVRSKEMAGEESGLKESRDAVLDILGFAKDVRKEIQHQNDAGTRGSCERTAPRQIAGTPAECSTNGHKGTEKRVDGLQKVKDRLKEFKEDDEAESPLIKYLLKRSMARRAIAFVIVLQARIMEQIGSRKMCDELKKLIQTKHWDSTFELEFEQARVYSQYFIKGASKLKKKDKDEDLETFLYVSELLSKGQPDSWIEFLGHLFIACEAESKIVELHRSYELKKRTIKKTYRRFKLMKPAEKVRRFFAKSDSRMEQLEVLLLQNIDSAEEILEKIKAERKSLKETVGLINVFYQEKTRVVYKTQS